MHLEPWLSCFYGNFLVCLTLRLYLSPFLFNRRTTLSAKLCSPSRLSHFSCWVYPAERLLILRMILISMSLSCRKMKKMGFPEQSAKMEPSKGKNAYGKISEWLCFFSLLCAACLYASSFSQKWFRFNLMDKKIRLVSVAAKTVSSVYFLGQKKKRKIINFAIFLVFANKKMKISLKNVRLK